jgi:predicted Zn-dependent protease with MMP-like domain
LELPRIRLFLDNLWDHSEGDLRRFRDELRITLLHELGHFLGLDEEQVANLGLE